MQANVKKKIKPAKKKLQRIRRAAADRRKKHELILQVCRLDPRLYDDAEGFLRVLLAV